MKLQNTATTNRLNTLTQTKKIEPSKRAPMASCIWNSGMKASMPTRKNRYTAGTNLRRGKRATRAPNTGASARVTTKVAA